MFQGDKSCLFFELTRGNAWVGCVKLPRCRGRYDTSGQGRRRVAFDAHGRLLGAPPFHVTKKQLTRLSCSWREHSITGTNSHHERPLYLRYNARVYHPPPPPPLVSYHRGLVPHSYFFANGMVSFFFFRTTTAGWRRSRTPPAAPRRSPSGHATPRTWWRRWSSLPTPSRSTSTSTRQTTTPTPWDWYVQAATTTTTTTTN